MIGPVLLSPGGLAELHSSRWGDAADSVVVADALRRELFARGAAVRRVLCGRVLAYLSPVLTDLDGERVGEVLEDLERCGDAAIGGGGWVGAAPLRVVWLGDGSVQIAAGAPTEWLRRPELGLGAVAPGLPRTGHVSAPQEAEFRAAVAREGGLIVAPERWAGLDEAPPAGPDYVTELDDRAVSDPSPADGGEWACYRPERAGLPATKRWDWRPDAPGRLWKVRAESGGWRYAWTGGGRPADGPWLDLSPDEACRAGIALDRAADNPVPCATAEAGGDVRIEVRGFLPRAEYRFLTTLGRRLPGPGPFATYSVPKPRWVRVREVLNERLGLGV